MSLVRGYIFSRPFMGERVPQHVQNIVIRDYCERNNLQYLLSATEYAMQNCHLVLKQVIGELSNIDGLVAYSLFQLPEQALERELIYKELIKQNKVLHFALESMKTVTRQEFEHIETLWQIRLTMEHCYEPNHE